jgi:simple sugar transport system ATP-binding protein
VSAPALELRNVTRRFGDVVALNDANLVVPKGTVHALLGENGAGKTTLMRIGYGMLRPDSGEVVVGGTRRDFASPAEAIGAGIGMVQQHPSNVAAMTVWENVVLGGSGRLQPDGTRQKVQALIDRLGFHLDPAALVSELSVAAQQRLEILKAVYRDARILILDEPTAILAPEEASELYGWLRTFANVGGTAIVVTHKLEEARRFTDQLTVLRAGRNVLEADSRSVSSDELTRAMIGESLAPVTRHSHEREEAKVVLQATALTLLDRRRVPVVRDATFIVRASEIVGVAGVEGSGHHQLLLAMAGRHPVAGGRIDSPQRVSIVPEDRHRDSVVLGFTLLENSAIRKAGARRGRVPWTGMRERARLAMQAFDVRAASPSSVMRTLSGGNQQKFVLARELEDDPELVVAENPTRGLDIRAAAFVREQLRAARERGAAVVVYSSDLDELLELADRVLVVQGGQVTEVPLDRTRIGAAMLGAA